jgi:heavy metal translocating P-type ATPase
MLARLGLSIFLTMSVMMFSMYLYRQGDSATSPTALDVQTTLGQMMRYLCLIFATPVFVLLAPPIFANAADQARGRILSTDALVVLGVGASFVYSYFGTLSGHGQTYYETGCAILVFMTLGRWLEASGRLRATDAVRSLESLFPETVEIERAGIRREIKPDEILTDDRLFVPAGQRVAADGEIEKGRAAIDEQIITGESTPVTRASGDLVRAGSLNLDGSLVIRATTTGVGSTLGRMIELLETAMKSRTRMQRISDRIATYFVPIVAVLAAVAALRAWNLGIDVAVMNALAVLLIACPCALGIATPMALWVALGAAAKRHILIRDGRAIEDLSHIRAFCFDKTGTLTVGQPVVYSFTTDSQDPHVRREILSRAAGLACGSRHVLAQAISRYAADEAIDPAPVDESRTVPGRGVVCRTNGTHLALGSTALMAEHRLSSTPALDTSLDDQNLSMRPVACIGWDGQVRGVFSFEETIRPNATAVLASLKRSGLDIAVLTGDRAPRGRELASALGVHVLAEQLPADKIRQLERIRRDSGPVAMVGDGLNDAPALAAADVGIALGCGADLTRSTASICLLGNDLAAIPWLVHLARRTVRTIKTNLFWAFAYNIVGIAFAMTGRLSPIFAAAAMVASSLLITANSLRLGNVREPAA